MTSTGPEHPPYAPQPPGTLVPLPWPHGPGRPGAATAAAVLGLVSGALTVLASLLFVGIVTAETAYAPGYLLTGPLGLACGVALLVGGTGLLRGRRPTLLVGAALAAVAVLLLSLGVSAVLGTADQALGHAMFTVVALPLPLVTAGLARRRDVLGWSASVG